jgi:hypothetical protein
MEDIPEAFDLNDTGIVFNLDEKSLGTVIINGRDMSEYIEGIHFHLTPGFAPVMTLRIMGFDFEAKATLSAGSVKWPAKIGGNK